MSEAPNLTYLISGLEIGGAEIGMARLLDGIPEDELDVTVVALDGGERTVVPDIPDHVDLVDLRIENKLFVHKLSPLIPILRETDILLGSIYHAEIVARLFDLVIPVDTLLTWAHNTQFKTMMRRWVDKFTIGRCDAVLADSEAVATMLVERQGVDPEKIWTVPIAGLSIDEYDRPSVLLQSLDYSVVGGGPLEHIGEGTIVIGTVGTLSAAKNHDAILEVASRLTDRKVHFAIAGDGPRREELVDEAVERGLANISFLGRIDSVPEFLSAVDIYFQPSHYEGLCITVLEAMAARKPIIASTAGEIPRNVRDGKEGFIADPEDIEAYVEAIETLLDDPKLRSQFGESSRQRVVERYSQETLVERFWDVLEKTYFFDDR
ncbi:glycosyltransferase family 4 protein [Halorubrum trueperi]|uniref:Glycosyltransferase family 4 protein n=1 Tax=Halorubrum trueperi TaxID=2004704 RepID=A0ABD5ULP1_9EURY